MTPLFSPFERAQAHGPMHVRGRLYIGMHAGMYALASKRFVCLDSTPVCVCSGFPRFLGLSPLYDAWFPTVRSWPILLTGLIDVIIISCSTPLPLPQRLFFHSDGPPEENAHMILR